MRKGISKAERRKAMRVAEKHAGAHYGRWKGIPEFLASGSFNVVYALSADLGMGAVTLEAMGEDLTTIFNSVTAQAFELDTGNQDLKVRWDNTLKYSNAVRTKSPSAQLTADPNLDDGNRNFGKGIISNRVDLLTELDVGYKDFGARLTGAAWYDTVYNRTNDNNSPATANAYSVPHPRFTGDTRDLLLKDGNPV